MDYMLFRNIILTEYCLLVKMVCKLRLLEAIQNFVRKYFHSYGIHKALILTEYTVLLYLYVEAVHKLRQALRKRDVKYISDTHTYRHLLRRKIIGKILYFNTRIFKQSFHLVDGNKFDKVSEIKF